MGIFDFLKSKKEAIKNPIEWDMHNHILFGIDDGSKSIEYSIEMAKIYLEFGYTALIASPHIMSDYYPNNRASIEAKAIALKAELEKQNLPLKLGFAAEYYMDEFFLEQVRSNKDLLTFYGNHILVETSFMNKPVFFDQLFFELRTKNIQPILAHPERYVYLQENYELVETLLQSGIKLQINLLSLDGYYSPRAKKLAQWLIKNNYYHFLGTDAHSTDHLLRLNQVYQSKTFSEINFERVENCSPFTQF
jgi:protein-tyrosine phosphatase